MRVLYGLAAALLSVSADATASMHATHTAFLPYSKTRIHNNASQKRPNLEPTAKVATLSQVQAIRGGGSDMDVELASNAFEWCANLGAPAALVGGAVLATMAETRSDMSPKKNDKRHIRIVKKLTRFLLLSAFALEIISIFVTTVTGTMLLSQADRPTGGGGGDTYHSAMGFLHFNHEFEYLTARITFLQGLFHWLIATALEVAVPKQGEGEAARKMNRFISSSLFTIILFMLSFYNSHMTFYENYFMMLVEYSKECWERFFWRWPPRPMMMFYGPALIVSGYFGMQAFESPPQYDQIDKDNPDPQ
mmetsp:Transcript_13803/g.20212  ORF Transcript_13803/g.20212 Transcript_13803/m.20212 type:complete len:306 (-) Transcript_13803:175-1092(-)|eukprot:CAMPEP_0194048462 /NCGR_PEP_ID=MMETSP0009_2-20130614/27342_1 /TAXON_ID=210454 /ORGANISM="Grammatophora oceanica, Strain CCMP 410" /LENGTH=305 /DNA_ID=CAMNT_0038694325 /DNA_START=75 /DNA_END=992 /DNA_ORIENTATION=-